MSYSLQNVFKGTAIYTTGQMLTRATGFFLIPVYTRFLTPPDYGIIGYLEVILQFLSVIFMFGFYGVQTRYFYEYKGDKRKLGEFLFTINLYLLCILCITCTVLSIVGKDLYPYLAIEAIPFQPYFPFIIWTLFFQIMNQMIISYYLASKQFRKSAILDFTLFVSAALLIIFFVVVLKEGAVGKIKGRLYAEIIFFIIFYIGYAKNFKFKFVIKYINYALSFGVPVVFHLLAAQLHGFIDRIILEKFVSMKQLGIYTLAYQLGMVMNILTVSVNKAWQPNYFDLMASSSKNKAYETRKMFALWIVAIGGICLSGMLWTGEFLFLLAPSEYYHAKSIVPLILFGYLLNGLYFFAISPVFYYKKTYFMPFLTGASALLNITLNFLLIPKYGIDGAAYATVFSFGFQAIVAYLVGRRFFNPEYELGKIFLLLIFVGTALLFRSYGEVSLMMEVGKISFLIVFLGTGFILFNSYMRPIITRITGLYKA